MPKPPPDPEFDGATVVLVIIISAAVVVATLWGLGTAFQSTPLPP